MPILKPEDKQRILEEIPIPGEVVQQQQQPKVRQVAPGLLSSIQSPSAPIPSAAIPDRKTELQNKVEEARMETAEKSDDQISAGIKQDFNAFLNKNVKDVPPEQKKDLKWLEAQYESLNQEYKGKQKDAEWRAVAETISNSLTKLFAARAGMKAGVDMSGLQLDRTDFNKELEGVRDDIARRRGQAENLFGQQEKQDAAVAAGVEKKAAKELERQRFEYQKSKDEKSQALAERELAAKTEQNRLSREATEEARQERLGTAKEAKKERNVLELSKVLKDGQAMAGAYDEIDKELAKQGVSLDDLQVKKGKLVSSKLNKEIDLPGVNLPGIGGVAFYSDDARDLRDVTQSVINTIVKERAGSAVANSEMSRIETEFSRGRFNTEAEKIQAIKRYKELMINSLKNKEAGFDPEAVKLYEERGGTTSSKFAQPVPAPQQNVDAKRARLMELRAKKEGK